MQPLTIPVGSRNPNGYTADEIRSALQGETGSRRFSFRYELLDENNVYKEDLTTVRSGAISQNWLADIKRTGSFVVSTTDTDPIDYLRDRIKPYVRLHMPPKELPAPPAELPPDPQTPPLFGGLTDSFDQPTMSSVWTHYLNGVSNVGGRMRIPMRTSTGTPEARSFATWGLLGSSVAVELARIPEFGVMGDQVSMTMVIYSNSSTTNLTIRYRKAGTTTVNKLEFQSLIASSDPGQVTIDYDPVEHRWLRIRESAGTVYMETSATGFPGTWQIQRSLATPSWVTSENNTHELAFRSAGNVNPDDYGEWDNLNLTPEGVETAFMPQQVWANNFNGTPGVTGEAITTSNSARHGNALDDVLGLATYSDAYSVNGGKSAKLGDDSGTLGGTLVARVRTALPLWSMRFYYQMASGAVLRVQPDGAVADSSNDILVDSVNNNVMLGTVSVPSILRSNFWGQDVKVEVITTLTLTVYRVFWTDPLGDSPDYVTSESNVGRDPLITVTASGGGSTTPPVWVDQLEVTMPATYERFTADAVNYVEWPQGVFILSSPQRSSDAADVITRTIQGYDLAQVLEDDLTADRFSTANLLRVDDNFSRSVSGGWGTSADGTVWLTATAGGGVSVFGTDVSGYSFARLGDDTTQIRVAQAGNTGREILVDSEVYVRMGVSQLATGNSLLGGIIFRLTSVANYYRVRLHYLTTGALSLSVTSTNSGSVTQHGDTVVTGLTYTAGEFLNVRAQCIGNTMRAKVWKSGLPEPAAWMIEEDVASAQRISYGYTGVSGSNFSGMTNVNPEHRFDLFQLNPNPGNTYTGVVDHILVEANLPRKITPSNSVIPTVKEWEAGTSKRQIIQDLLTAINYESLAFDEEGYAVVKPYVSPQVRGSEYTYADDELSVMYPEVMQELDLFNIPNRWILTVSDPDRDALTVSFTNSDPASPTSTVRRGRVITRFEQGEDADSEATLIDKASRMAFEASQVYEALEFSTGLMPIHSGNDVYTLQYDPLGTNGQYAEVSWDMELRAGAAMRHRARRVITLDAGSDPSIINQSVDVTGALDAGNIAAGSISITPVANKPTRGVVSGLNLKGRGTVSVIVTALTTVPGSIVKEVTVYRPSAYGFQVWMFRTSSSATTVNWFAIRGA